MRKLKGFYSVLQILIYALFIFTAIQAFSQTPEFGTRQDFGIIQNDLIREASGLVASLTNPGIFWTHN
ncbi:hypothetical protein BVY01_02125, partial [bacterium I07]